jgi:membrane-associated protein
MPEAKSDKELNAIKYIMHFFQITPLIQTIGLLGVFCLVFAESGLFFGFFLPGDSLIFSAGFMASAGYFNVAYLLIGCFVAAVLGDSVGYYFGKKTGSKLFNRPKSFFFSRRNLEKTIIFYKKHGNKTITLARFVPIVRTFAPIMAGVGEMEYKTFLFWNVLGGACCTSLMILGGYFLGNYVKNVDRLILPIILLIVILSIVPILVQFTRRAEEKNNGGENGSGV